MIHHRIAAVVIMTALLGCRKVEAQRPKFDGAVAVASAGNGFAGREGTSGVIGEASFSSSSSGSGSSGSGGGVYLTRADERKSKTAALDDERKMRPFSTVAMGLRISSLGAGFELATPLGQRVNLRSIVNSVDYGQKFVSGGGNYNAEVHFHSAEVLVDWFPFHGRFHISPGMMAFNNKLAGQVRVGADQTFDIEDYELLTGPGGYVQGSATATYQRRIAPVLMMGFGNILPRDGRHFSAPFEFGFMYPGPVQISSYLVGQSCTDDGCDDLSSDSEVQGQLQQKVTKLNSELKVIQVYPIVSMGLAYRF